MYTTEELKAMSPEQIKELKRDVAKKIAVKIIGSVVVAVLVHYGTEALIKKIDASLRTEEDSDTTEAITEL